jgi:type I restriction enzyme, S subunit
MQRRLKQVVTITVSNVDKKSVDGDPEVRLCNYTDVYYNERITSALDFMESTATRDQIRQFRLLPGDVIITKDSETPDDIGIPALVVESVPALICGYHLAVLRPHEALDGRYLFWALAGQQSRSQLTAAASGVTRFGLRYDLIGDLVLPVPDREQQRVIADYLDAETARIDALIQMHESLTSLATERSRATVERTVRQGLHGASACPDPHPWIVEVPCHWDVLPLKRIGKLQAGAAFPDDEQGQTDNPIPYFKVRDFETPGNEEHLATGENTVTKETARRLRSPIIPAGSIVFPKIGAALLSNRRRILTADSCIDQNVMALTVTRGVPRFFYFLLQTLDFGRLRMPGPVPLLNEQDAANLSVPVPPHDEQEQIAAHLDNILTPLRSVSVLSSRAIETLRQHRQALITAAVMGELQLSGNDGAKPTELSLRRSPRQEPLKKLKSQEVDDGR